jgi:hypothetical protein
MTSTPTPNVRLTISVTPEVHATFKRLADASGMSISRAMGEWLLDTIEGAEFMAGMVEKARSAPRQVVQEMHAMSLGTADLLTGLLADLRTGKKGLPPERATGRPAAGPSPRPVIRGDKSSPKYTPKPRGAK